MLRIGLIGCGAAGKLCHLPAILESRTVRLAAVVDGDIERARAAAQHTSAAACKSIAEAIPNIDAAVVALPNSLHASASIELLKAGRHVLVEKPMAITTEQCQAMVQAANEGGATLAVGHMRRFQPSIQFAQSVIQRGWLGEVTNFECAEGSPFQWPANSDYLLHKTTAGRGVLI